MPKSFMCKNFGDKFILQNMPKSTYIYIYIYIYIIYLFVCVCVCVCVCLNAYPPSRFLLLLSHSTNSGCGLLKVITKNLSFQKDNSLFTNTHVKYLNKYIHIYILSELNITDISACLQNLPVQFCPLNCCCKMFATTVRTVNIATTYLTKIVLIKCV